MKFQSGRLMELYEIAFAKTKSISDSATTFALATGNSGLGTLVALKRYKLDNARQLDRVVILRGVLTAAEEYLGELPVYGISTAEWSEASSAIDAYEAAVVRPNRHIRNRVAVGANVVDIFRNGQLAIQEMKGLLHLYKVTNKDFVDGFLSHCKVNHLAGRHKSGEGGDAEAS